MFLIYNVLTKGMKTASHFGTGFLVTSLKRTMKRNQPEISLLPKDILVDGTYEEMKPVNGQHLYDEDDDDDDDDVDDDDDTVEEDLIIGDEDAVGDEEEFDVELEDDIDEDDIDDDDLVIDADDDVDDEDEDL
jgi:hypothetical protein